MWTFVETVRTESNFGTWYALVTLTKDGSAESFYIRFGAEEPSLAQADAAGVDLALRKNYQEAPPAPDDAMAREDFIDRFTNDEIAAIYRASDTDDAVFAYVKRMELSPVIRKSNAYTIAGVELLESATLIGVGRAAEILI